VTLPEYSYIELFDGGSQAISIDRYKLLRTQASHRHHKGE